jgi:hypothetical protein
MVMMMPSIFSTAILTYWPADSYVADRRLFLFARRMRETERCYDDFPAPVDAPRYIVRMHFTSL